MFIFFGIKLDVCNHFESVHYITMKKVVPLFLVAVVLFSCDENTTEEKDVFFEKTLTPILKNEVSFINPPIKGLNVPKESFTVNAKLGDTLFDKSGSILIFPKNSFVDASGNIIKGDVKVEYREFSDPFDFFVSGIPDEKLGEKLVLIIEGKKHVIKYKNLGLSKFETPKKVYFLEQFVETETKKVQRKKTLDLLNFDNHLNDD